VGVRQVVFFLNADIIKGVPYFLNKNKDFVLHIVSLLAPLFVGPGETLYSEGEVALEMFFLVKGVVEIVADIDGAEVQCAVMREGSYFGELALLMGIRRSTTARVIEHSNLFVLNKVRCGACVGLWGVGCGVWGVGCGVWGVGRIKLPFDS
jgi:CRP/FNR family transcriptional regulator